VQPWEVTLFGVAFAVSLCVALVFLWGGTAAYYSILGDEHERSTLTDIRTGEQVVPLRPLSTLHDGWFDYVTARSAEQPDLGGRWFTDDERRHMSDVRSVFIGVQALAVAAVVVLVALARRAAQPGTLPSLVLAGAIAAAIGVAAIGATFAVAFDVAFLFFHEILFPQGNFLFPPGSNLLVIYPEPYWYGITLRISISFLVAAAIVAGLAQIAVVRASTARSAIVTPR
jgi:uncharacterized membrane protein